MRIISGIFKGMKLYLPQRNITRPLKDLTKESIFNLIIHSKKINIDIKDSLILDLFSGSGSFGIECISRGTKKVTFFENNTETIKVLEKNLLLLKGVNNFEICDKDIFNFFSKYKNFDTKFDIIFIDPPYKERKINDIIENIFEKSLLKSNGVIIIHKHKKDFIKVTKQFKIIEERKYGISKILFIS